MTIATITALPTVPATNDSGFESAANALFTAIKDVMIGEINTMIGQINVYDFGLNMNIGNIVGLTAGRIPFGTGTGALSSSASLFWDNSNKRLGIGTASPIAKTHIHGTGTVNSQIVLSNDGTYHTGLIGSSNAADPTNDSNAWFMYGGPNTYLSGTAYKAGIGLSTNVPSFRISAHENPNSGGTSLFEVLRTGNVGIGTASPSTKLDVDGVIKVKSYTVATQPSAVAGGIIYVSDDVGGAVLAFSDGSDWRRVTDRAVTSAT